MPQGKGAGGAGAAGGAGGRPYWCTPSIEAALCAALPGGKLIGVQEGSSSGVGIQTMAGGARVYISGLDRQQAAVAHDLCVIWRVDCRGSIFGGQGKYNKLNVPSAGYRDDAALMQQLRSIGDSKQLTACLSAMFPRKAQPRQQRGQQQQQPRQQRGQQQQQEAQQQQQRREREEQQKQQRARRRLQRTLVLGRDAEVELEGAGVTAAEAAPQPVPPVGSRKRKQHPPARVAQPQAAACAAPAAEAAAAVEQPKREIVQGPRASSDGEQHQGSEGSLLPTRPVSAAGTAAGAEAAETMPSAQPAGQPLTGAGRQHQQQEAQPAASLPPPSPGILPLLAGRAAEAARRKVDQAVRSFAAAEQGSPASMLRPLQHLLLALGNTGGGALQEVVAGWGGYPLARQQEVFDAALVVASHGGWGQLEGQLRLALDLTAGG